MKLTGKLEPQEFWARIDQSEARIRADVGVLPLFGLDGWTGSRMTGDWEWENGRLVAAGLAHGDPQGAGGYVHVKTTAGDPMEVALGRRMSTRMAGIERDEFPAVRDRLAADLGTRVAITVEDVPCEFHLWRDDDSWLAAARHSRAGLVVEASADVDVAQVRLVRVTDVEPYIAGRRARLLRLRGEDA